MRTESWTFCSYHVHRMLVQRYHEQQTVSCTTLPAWTTTKMPSAPVWLGCDVFQASFSSVCVSARRLRLYFKPGCLFSLTSCVVPRCTFASTLFLCQFALRVTEDVLFAGLDSEDLLAPSLCSFCLLKLAIVLLAAALFSFAAFEDFALTENSPSSRTEQLKNRHPTSEP